VISMPTPPTPQAPLPPANPPLLGSQAPSQGAQRSGAQVAPLQGFSSTILGQTNPTNTGMKTLLGQ